MLLIHVVGTPYQDCATVEILGLGASEDLGAPLGEFGYNWIITYRVRGYPGGHWDH